jgi:hypothetical protein
MVQNEGHIRHKQLWMKEDSLTCAALAGTSIVAVIQLVGVEKLDIPLWIAVYSFAISIPFLGFYSLFLILRSHYENSKIPKNWFFALMLLFGPLASMIGLCAVFWHLAWAASLLFATISIACIISYAVSRRRIESVNKNPEQPKTQ